MQLPGIFSVLATALCVLPAAAERPATLASVLSDLREISIDPEQTYQVLDLQFTRGDAKIYLTAGTLLFTKPVAGRVIAAVFTTVDTQAGDGEIVLIPPTRGERESLAKFAKSPNLDEHFSSAVFFFSDDTANELLAQLHERSHPAPDEGRELKPATDRVIRGDATSLDVRLARSLLDNHPSAQGFFYGVMGGRTLGVFDLIYEPSRTEAQVVGQVQPASNGGDFFQIWTSFRPRHKPADPEQPGALSNYRIETTIDSDLAMTSHAKFTYRAALSDGRAISLELSNRLSLSSATIDGRPAEFFQQNATPSPLGQAPGPLLLAASEPLSPGSEHEVEVTYSGTVVVRTQAGNYFVNERNTWYPLTSPMLTTFDLTFRCPAALRLVSSGDLISDEVSRAGIRTVHRRTRIPEPLAGFNIGDYQMSSLERGPYHIELFANSLADSAGLPAQAAEILDFFSKRWLPLDIHTLAISPIEGNFGQGFPGLIYLSSVSYLREEDRPAALRDPRLDSFFSEMLLPHEMAHQWWGNMVSASNYRAEWLFEAMASYAAMEYLEQSKGRAAVDDILERYRQDLLALDHGAQVESAGPLDFGERLLDNSGLEAWRLIIYEKGAWVLHMLRERLGAEGFHRFEASLLEQYRNKLIDNDDTRQLAARFVPRDQPDPSLDLFFDDWVYSTGIPSIAMKAAARGLRIKVSSVDEGFDFDLPLVCDNAAGTRKIVWVRVGPGDNSFDMPPGQKSCALPESTDFLYSRK